jgi:oligopeptidase B
MAICKKIKNYNPDLYDEKTFIVNKAKTCITILFKKSLVNLSNRNKKNPCIMHVYGAYGSNYSSMFDLFNQILLDKGFIICYAHVRGGGYYGKRWYLAGKMNKKMNTFLDTIDCAEYLIKHNITSSDKLTLWGRSAGGLTVGAVINMRPDLFNLAILGVPFVDVINEMMDKNTPLTTEEYQEWGNPNKKKVYDYIMKYSPYQNIKKNTKYPNIYIYSNINDSLVGYWVPLKYYLKIKECDVFQQNPDKIHLNIKKQYGHAQSSNRFEHIGEMTEIYAIILHYNK